MKKIIITGALLTAALVAAPSFAGDAAAGKAKSVTCAACHGQDGISMAPTYPNLKGQKAEYLKKTLTGFRDGTRADPTMNAMAKPLTDADIADLAAYYSSLK